MKNENMDLKDFISTTIIDICMGIKDAQKTVHGKANNMPVIAPAFLNGVSQLEDNVEKISFDILVSATNTTNAQKGVGAKIHVINGSIGKENSSVNIAENRISFSVPFYPQALEQYKNR
ncbi:MAG: hypothetical protein LBL08_01110 [Candidatus Nomurabacteria bacterium]|jgi:hypothetical protein|nr:hypothetical protein [Candidatus Nomurabacteria bacterium]